MPISRLLSSTLLMLLLTTLTLGQAPTSSKADSTYKKAVAFKQRFALDSAIYYYNLASRQHLEAGNKSLATESKVQTAGLLAYQGRFAQAYSLLDSIIVVEKNSPAKDSSILHQAYYEYGFILERNARFKDAVAKADSALVYNYAPGSEEWQSRQAKLLYRKGFSLFQQLEFDTAIVFFEQSRDLFDAVGNELNKASAINQLGALKVQQMKGDEALVLLEACRKIYQNSPDINPELLGSLLLNMGEAYRSLTLYEEAIISFKQSLEYFVSMQENHPALTVVNPQLGFTLSELERYDEAVQFLQQGLQLSLQYYGPNNIRTITNKYLLGLALAESGQYTEAIDLFQEVFETLNTHLKGAALDIRARMLFEQGFAYFHQNSYDKGFRLMKEGISESKGESLHILRQKIKFSRLLAKAYRQAAQPDSAIKYFKLSLAFSERALQNRTPTPQAIYDLNRYENYLGMVSTYHYKYKMNQERGWLDSAYQSIVKAESEVSSLRGQPVRLSDRFSAGERISTSLVGGINVCYELYQLSGNETYAAYAYQLIEQSKSNQALFKELGSNPLSVPDSILIKEEALHSRLSYFEGLVYEEVRKNGPDTELTQTYQSEIVLITDEIVRFSQSIKNAYPRYFSLKYDRQFASIKDIQDELLSKGELLLNYHYADSSLYVVSITKAGFSFGKKALSNNFNSDILALSALLNTPRFDKASRDQFLTLSQGISRVVLPSLDGDEIKKITVIPGGLIHLLPFEVLVNQTETSVKNYNQIPYLIRDYDFRYSSSSTLLLEQSKQRKSPTDNSVIAFAPSFQEHEGKPFVKPDSVRDALGFLAYTKKEVEDIGKHFQVELLLDSNATERAFRNGIAKPFRVIHIASHGMLDDENSLYSKLLFAPSKNDSLADGYLYTNEIMSLSTMAEMVVLSACNSGSGNIIAGEGVMSLANGFSYAGAKSIVNTRWTANDESSATIMDSFYKYLAEGLDKSQALRTAQLDYLENANSLLAHPYYWAHFNVNGNDSPITSKRRNWSYGLTVGIIIFLIAMVLFIRRKEA